MRKVICTALSILFAINIIVSLGFIIPFFAGYYFSLYNYEAFGIILTAIAITVVVLGFMRKETDIGLTSSVISCIILPVSFITWLYFISLSDWKPMVFLMAVCSACAAYFAFRYGKPYSLKITAIVISAIMILPLCFISFVDLTFGDFVETTVAQTIYSPNENYKVQVIDSDQGALGGNTFVEVYDTRAVVDLWVIKVSKEPKRVYSGEWGESQNMQIFWEDNSTISINGELYSVK